MENYEIIAFFEKKFGRGCNWGDVMQYNSTRKRDYENADHEDNAMYQLMRALVRRKILGKTIIQRVEMRAVKDTLIIYINTITELKIKMPKHKKTNSFGKSIKGNIIFT